MSKRASLKQIMNQFTVLTVELATHQVKFPEARQTLETTIICMEDIGTKNTQTRENHTRTSKRSMVTMVDRNMEETRQTIFTRDMAIRTTEEKEEEVAKAEVASTKTAGTMMATEDSISLNSITIRDRATEATNTMTTNFTTITMISKTTTKMSIMKKFKHQKATILTNKNQNKIRKIVNC